jgi:hypothetical protein
MDAYEICSAIVEGKDNADNEALQEVCRSVQEIVRNGRIFVASPSSGKEYDHTSRNFSDGNTDHRLAPVAKSQRIQFWGGGDMVYIGQMTGTTGGFARDAECCPWCETPKDMLSALPSHNVEMKMRTLERQYHYAHCAAPSCARADGTEAFPFTCPACEKQFFSSEVSISTMITHFHVVSDLFHVLQQDVEKDHASHASDGETAVRTYISSHRNVKNGQPPMIDIDIMRHVGCCLHLNISVVGTLWEHGLCVSLSGDGASARVNAINSRLAGLSVHK